MTADTRTPPASWAMVLVSTGLLAWSWWASTADSVTALEEDGFRFFNDWPDWLEGPIWPIMQLGAIAIVPVAAVIAQLIWRKWRLTVALAAGGLAAWILAKVIKSMVERGRPQDYLDAINLRPAWEGLGYPSGHAAVAFTLATVISPQLSRPWQVVVWVLATVTGILRMYTAAHLPLDIVGGAALGVIVGVATRLALGLDAVRTPTRQAVP